MLKGDYSIDDFDEADFLNPISLLAALQKLSLREVENAQDESSCDFLTVADIQRQYGLSEDYIRSAFQNCRDIKIVDPFRDLGEIKFGNSSDRKLMRQDEFPGLAPELERPFCVFYARSGESIIIDFDEETCIISAELC